MGTKNSFSVQFPKASLQKTALRFLFGELECSLIGLTSVGGSAEPPAEIGPGGMGQMVAGQVRTGEDRVDQLEARLRSVTHRHGHRTIQFDNG